MAGRAPLRPLCPRSVELATGRTTSHLALCLLRSQAGTHPAQRPLHPVPQGRHALQDLPLDLQVRMAGEQLRASAAHVAGF